MGCNFDGQKLHIPQIESSSSKRNMRKEADRQTKQSRQEEHSKQNRENTAQHKDKRSNPNQSRRSKPDKPGILGLPIKSIMILPILAKKTVFQVHV